MKLKKGIPVIDQGDRLGFWGGKFGGNFVPETLKKPIEDLEIQFNRLKNDAKSLNEAILHSAAQRLRPIVLTTTTTMIGLTPVALQTTIDWFGRSIEFGGLMSAWWVPFSTAVIWGLGFSSLLTLFLIPALLALPEYLKEKNLILIKNF